MRLPTRACTPKRNAGDARACVTGFKETGGQQERARAACGGPGQQKKPHSARLAVGYFEHDAGRNKPRTACKPHQGALAGYRRHMLRVPGAQCSLAGAPAGVTGRVSPSLRPPAAFHPRTQPRSTAPPMHSPHSLVTNTRRLTWVRAVGGLRRAVGRERHQRRRGRRAPRARHGRRAIVGGLGRGVGHRRRRGHPHPGAVGAAGVGGVGAPHPLAACGTGGAAGQVVREKEAHGAGCQQGSSPAMLPSQHAGMQAVEPACCCRCGCASRPNRPGAGVE